MSKIQHRLWNWRRYNGLRHSCQDVALKSKHGIVALKSKHGIIVHDVILPHGGNWRIKRVSYKRLRFYWHFIAQYEHENIVHVHVESIFQCLTVMSQILRSVYLVQNSDTLSCKGVAVATRHTSLQENSPERYVPPLLQKRPVRYHCTRDRILLIQSIGTGKQRTF